MTTDMEFDRLKDDPEFKEFLSLQRNVGPGQRSKQIWSDDLVMETENKPVEKKNGIDGKLSIEKKLDLEKPRKKHKRSRGKKKSTKAKPKELFVHTIKIKGLPEEIRRKDVKDFFKPLELLSIRNNKKDQVCYVSFKSESDRMFAMKKDRHFCGMHRVKMWLHDVKRSRIFKEAVREKKKQKEEMYQKYEEKVAKIEPVEESGRIFVRNLNYKTCTSNNLEELFSKYGELTEIHFPIDKNTSTPKGFAHIEFRNPQDAAKAYQELNGTTFQERKLHLIPSKPKPDNPNVEFRPSEFGPDAMSSYKREKLANEKKVAHTGSNWNILFLGQNALANVVSDMKGIEKSKLLTQQTSKEPIAVRLALGDAAVVEEMRKFLVTNGVELDSFDNPQAPRSRTCIIVKNLPTNIDKVEVAQLFEAHGRVTRAIVPPNGMTGIVEFEEPKDAKRAFTRLANSKFRDSILYLEWAPINVFREKSLEDQEQDDMKQLTEMQTGTKILVKNIPFEATPSELKKLFAPFGEINFTRMPKKLDGQHRGFGFVDFLTKEDALRAFSALCHSTHLYGRRLVLEWAKTDEANSTDKSK